MGKWIDASRRLPKRTSDPCETVIVRTKDGKIGAGYFWKDNNIECCVVDETDDCLQTYKLGTYITHWQHLPKFKGGVVK